MENTRDNQIIYFKRLGEHVFRSNPSYKIYFPASFSFDNILM